jgi:NADH:ubiquinone oxidoreductase subunit
MKRYRIHKVIALVLLAASLGIGIAARQRESSRLQQFRSLVAETKRDSTAEKVTANWDAVMKSWAELSPAEKQLIIREKQTAAKDQPNPAVEAFFAADSKESQERILDKELLAWEQKMAAKEKWRAGQPAKKSVSGTEQAQSDQKAKTMYERSYLDSSSAEQRARKQAFYEALKSRYRELND